MEDKERRTKTAQTILTNRRNYRRARDRALAKLSATYREEYLELLEEERKKDEAEGKSWLDISGRTKRSLGSAGAPDGQGGISIRYTDSNRQETRNLGGEE
jgi:hypothetical protein